VGRVQFLNGRLLHLRTVRFGKRGQYARNAWFNVFTGRESHV
jgi:hypothetical protein